MAASADEIFRFLRETPEFQINRIEVACADFAQLRRAIRMIVTKIAVSDELDCGETGEALRVLLSEWLTVPVIFDSSMHDRLHSILGELTEVEHSLGRDIGSLYRDALKSAKRLPVVGNPLRSQIRDLILDLQDRNRTFRVFCQRRAIEHFESICSFLRSSDSGVYIHTLADYKKLLPVDVIVKVGPIRSRGWGSMPEAVLTSPRCRTIYQIVWSGCQDEPDFGYDPLAVLSPSSTQVPTASARSQWAVKTLRVEDIETQIWEEPEEVDELQIFHELGQRLETRPASLLQIDEDAGLLVPRNSQVLCFDPGASVGQVSRRDVSGILESGTFLLRPSIQGPDDQEQCAIHGQFYCLHWKDLLQAELQKDPLSLIKRLRLERVNLLHLHDALALWAKASSSVVHAPKRKPHFVSLMKVLGMAGQRAGKQSWTDAAWTEVMRSRGEAIQAGTVENEALEASLLAVLEPLLPAIRRKSETTSSFVINLPRDSSSVQGCVRFDEIRTVEHSFRAPESRMLQVTELKWVEQWRV